jgi:hypothetical protein
LGLGFVFGKEICVKFGDFSKVGEGDSASRFDKKGSTLSDFTFLQVRANAALNILFWGGFISDNPMLQEGSGSELLAYKVDGSSARLRGMLDYDGARYFFNGAAWTNAGKVGVGGISGIFGSNDFSQSALPGNKAAPAAKYVNGGLGVVAAVPWIYAFAQGLNELVASTRSEASSVSGFLQVDISPQFSFEASLFNRMLGFKGSGGFLVDGGFSGLGSGSFKKFSLSKIRRLLAEPSAVMRPLSVQPWM